MKKWLTHLCAVLFLLVCFMGFGSTALAEGKNDGKVFEVQNFEEAN
ncbi:MAG: hypothetical protein PUJ57_04370 [Peptoniphilaceae bacterium]|nr:hypothetical protein [Peptoniphilaceae bacterium]MDY6085351.1 hypothetical protein [Peptoniphilaceae bacterium]